MNKRLKIIETNYGRDSGWHVEVDGRKVARLADPKWEDLFWYSYRLEPLTTDPRELAMLYSAEFWDSCKAVYRNCEFDEVAPFAFAGGISLGLENRLRQTGRLFMRGLYLTVPNYPWDGLLLWLRRRRKTARTTTPEPEKKLPIQPDAGKRREAWASTLAVLYLVIFPSFLIGTSIGGAIIANSIIGGWGPGVGGAVGGGIIACAAWRFIRFNCIEGGLLAVVCAVFGSTLGQVIYKLAP